MKGKMKAAILHKISDMRFGEVEIPQIGPKDVLVEMKRVGICGSDIHFYLEGRIGSSIVEKPLILGHECAGEVAEVGEDVKSLGIGQRVAIEPGFTCGKCEYCRTGRYNLCKAVKFYGTPPYDGAFVEFVSAPEQNVFSLPDNMTLEEGAMIEPLAVGMMAAKRGNVTVHDSVAIFGAGPIGQMCLSAVKACGVIRTYVVDVVDYRLACASEAGATHVVDSAKTDAAKRLLDLTNNDGVDVVIEASGADSAIQQSLDIVKPGGRIVLVGYPGREVPFPVTKVISKELDIRGVHRYANVFQTAIEAVSSGKIEVKQLITHRFPFDKILEGFETHIRRNGNPMKVEIII